ncbi:MAG TPA: hypothetical protein VFV23_05935 [Verrucomicrobiae bacterium]|nr:hypothetical protein [Verrucomicrobiae bacterium]
MNKLSLLCAMGAALMLCGNNQVSAVTVEGQVVFPLNIQLTGSIKNNGTVRRVRITNKDILNSINDQFMPVASGDRVAMWENEILLLDKNDNIVTNLSYEGVMEVNFGSPYFYRMIPSGRVTKFIEAGQFSLYFDSAGYEDTAESEVWFDINCNFLASGGFIYFPTGQFEMATVESSARGTGFKASFDDLNNLNISGKVTAAGSGFNLVP